MVNLSERQSVILELLSEAGRPMTGAELSDLLGVSPRTVRADIGRLNRTGTSPALVQSSGAGYSVNPDGYQQVVGQSQQVAQVVEDDERLLRYLLDVDQCSVFDLALDCYLSETAARSGLQRLTGVLHSCGLEVSIKGSTVSVNGDELGRRRLLGVLVRAALNARVGATTRLDRLLPDVPIAEVEEVIAETFADSPVNLNDISRQNFAVNLAILLQRSGNAPLHSDGAAELTGAEAAVADRLVAALRARWPHRLQRAGDATSIRQLTAVALAGAVAEPGGLSGPTRTVEAVIRDAVDECIAHFDLTVQRDRLVSALTLHTRRLLARANTYVYFRNGLRESLRTRSPFLYDVAVYLAHLISGPLNFRATDDEISLLAIYLGLYSQHQDLVVDAVRVVVVCPRYQTLREWLLGQLMENFGDQIDIVDIVATEPEAAATGAELVISAAGGGARSADLVEISALCSDLDIDAIRSSLGQIRQGRRQAHTARLLGRFLDRRQFFTAEQFGDATSTIEFLCDRLRQAGAVGEDFVTSVLTREEYSSTAFSHRFAVPHAMEFIANRTTISVLIPRQPIGWGESEVVMVLLLAINPADYADFSAAYQPLIHLLCRADTFTELRGLRDFDLFRAYLTSQVAESE